MKPKSEIPLKQWLYQQSLELRITPNSVWCRLKRGAGFPGVRLRYVNSRVVFVRYINKKLRK